MTAMDASQDGKRLLRRWLMVFFGVMFAANGVFLWFALTTHTGLSSRNAYEEGRLYNDIIAADARLDALGWQLGVDWDHGQMMIELFDANDLPLDGEVVSAQLFRPSSAKDDLALTFNKAGEGVFVSELIGIAGGHWQLRMKYAAAGDVLEMRQDIQID